MCHSWNGGQSDIVFFRSVSGPMVLIYVFYSCILITVASGLDNPVDDRRICMRSGIAGAAPSECINDNDEVALMQGSTLLVKPAAQLDGKEVPPVNSMQSPFSMMETVEASPFAMMETIERKWDLKQVCVEPENIVMTLEKTVDTLIGGIPPWPTHEHAPSIVPDVKIAFLIQVAFAKQLPLVARAFAHIYGENDVFVYFVDRNMLDADKVRAVLPDPLPSNVFVEEAPHAGYFYWPRVQVLLDEMNMMMSHQWDFVIHMSESDYPVHRMSWIRQSLAKQRQTNFIDIAPKCWKHQRTGDVIIREDNWYWWAEGGAVATCGSAFPPKVLDNVRFPVKQTEEKGFIWAAAPEWMILTRELVQYTLNPQLLDFKRFISMHSASDEIFWATLVLNIPGFKQTLSSQGWFQYRPPNSGHSPATLAGTHEHMLTPNRHLYFFMRKVEEIESSDLLGDVDRLLATSEEFPGPIPASQSATLQVAGLECGQEGTNFGEMKSPFECAESVLRDKGCGNHFMFSVSYPSWGCRCCTPTGGEGGNLNPEWDLFIVGAVEAKASAVSCAQHLH